MINAILTSVVENNKERGFTLAIHHYEQSRSLIQLSSDAGFHVVREYTVCVIPTGNQFMVHTELSSKITIIIIIGGVDAVRLVRSQCVIIGWFGGEEPPPNHPLHEEANTFMCCPEENEPTQCATEPLLWLKHVALTCARGKCILELYSECGMSHALKMCTPQ